MGGVPSLESTNLTAACDAARAPLHPDFFDINETCTVVNGSCPAECASLIENVLDICPGEEYFFPILSGPNPTVTFSAGVEVATLMLIIAEATGLGGACTSTPLDALIESGVYAPTCADGLELLVGSSFLCSGPNGTGCPEVCERMMDVAFDVCTEEGVVRTDGLWGAILGEIGDGIDEFFNATQAVALSLESLGSSDCSEVLASKSFRASSNPEESTSEEAKTTSTGPGGPTRPAESTSEGALTTSMGPGRPTMPAESTSAEAQATSMGASRWSTTSAESTSAEAWTTSTAASGVPGNGNAASASGRTTTSGSLEETVSSTPGSSLPAAALVVAAALVSAR